MASGTLSPCCRCNATGKCVRCVCVQAGRCCSNCAPSRDGLCRNRPFCPPEGTSSTRLLAPSPCPLPPVPAELNLVLSTPCPVQKGGFPTIRHNEVRDLTASLLTEICHNVGIESSLQPLDGEEFATAPTTTYADEACLLDIVA